MNTVIINEIEYIVLGDEFFNKAPIYCKKSRNPRELVKKNKITDFIFAREIKKVWTITNGKTYKYDKILLKKSFIDTIPECNQVVNETNTNNIVDDNGIGLAPEIIYLEDSEKFKDNDGNIIEIETRGERNVDKIYFYVKDIMKGFEMENLNDVIIDKRREGYNEGIHYTYFICKKTGKDGKITNNTIIKKELYLTYMGILRVLFVSHSPKVSTFVKWATESLFTLQMGTQIQKDDLISSVLGVSAKVIKEVFNTDTHTLPSVYLFSIGFAKDLRKSMNIDASYNDDDVVAKYGFTKDLSRRTGEHIVKYSKIPNTNLRLKYNSYIDPQYISQAESDIRLFMSGLKLNHDYGNDEELVIIPKNLNKLVEHQYSMIGKNYMGHVSELITKIKELEDKYEKILLTHKIELQNETHARDIQREKYENELLKKDIEIMKILLNKQ